MAASYPSAAKLFATRTTGQIIAASHIDDLQDEVTAMETDLVNGLPVVRGGTGLVAGVAGGVPFFTGTTAMASTAAGGATTFLRGGATPAFSALAGADLTSAFAVRMLDRKVTLTDVVSSSTKTTVYTFSVPGGTLSTNKVLRLTAIGDYLNNTGGADIFTMTVEYGATILLTYSLNMGANASRRDLQFHAMLAAANATSAQTCGGTAWLGSVGAAAGTMIAPGSNLFSGINTATEDSTAAKTFKVTFQHSSISANLSARLQVALLELCE